MLFGSLGNEKGRILYSRIPYAIMWEIRFTMKLNVLVKKKTYQENIVVEKSEEKGSKENWYPMAYPQKKEEKIGELYFYMLFWFPKEMAN